MAERSSLAVFLRSAIAIDPLSMRCPAATGLSECLLLWNARLPLLPSEMRRKSAGYSKEFQSFGYAYMSAVCRTSTRDDDPGLGHELIS